MWDEALKNLKYAVETDRTDVVKSILATCETEEGEVVTKETLLDALTTSDGTLLHFASKYGKVDIVRTLLSTGSDPGVHNLDGFTALDLAHQAGHEPVVHIFSEQLLQSTAYSDVGRVCQLLAAGVQVNLIDSPENKNTPLHWAATYGGRDIIKCLCSRGACVNAVNTHGATPLHEAVSRNNAEAVTVLMQYGADVSIAPTDGKYAGLSSLDLAASTPHLLEILQSPPPREPSMNGVVADEIDQIGLARSTNIETMNVDAAINVAGIRQEDSDDYSDILSESSLGDTGELLPELPHDGNGTVKHHITKADSVDSYISEPPMSPQTPSAPAPPPSLSHGSPFLTQNTYDYFAQQSKGSRYETQSSNPEPEAEGVQDPFQVQDKRLTFLWPRPQKMVQKPGLPFKIPRDLLLFNISEGPSKESAQKIVDILDLRRPELEKLGYKMSVDLFSPSLEILDPYILCHINSRLFDKPESYKLAVLQSQMKILASDASGFFHAISTLIQLLNLCGDDDAIPHLQITDWASLKYRGVLLDFSKGRIPTLDTLRSTLDKFALLKINQVHFYTRFSLIEDEFGQKTTWQFPYRRRDLLDVEKYCRDRFITLVPVLDVSPKVFFHDLSDLYIAFRDYISCFPSSDFINLGPRLSSFLLDTNEEDSLVLDDAYKLLPLLRDHTTQVCAYVFHEGLAVVQQCIPSNMMLFEYGFQADYNFSKYCKLFADCGLPFYVCPGTASWNSLSGCPEAAVSNAYKATQAAVAFNAVGFLNCSWAGVGGIHHLPFIWPGIMTGAGLGWNASTDWDTLHSNLAELLNLHVFVDEGSPSVFGHVILELGRAETYIIRCSRKQAGNDQSNLPAESGSTLHQLVTHPDQVSLDNLSSEVFQKAMRHIRRCQNQLGHSKLECYQHDMIMKEIYLTADLMMLACKIGRALTSIGRNPSQDHEDRRQGQTGLPVVNLGVSNLSGTSKTDLANRMLGLVERYKSCWLARHEPLNLAESLRLLTGSGVVKQCITLDEHS